MHSKHMNPSRATNEEFMTFVKKFSYKLMAAINRQAVATPHGIIASAILNGHKNSFSKGQMIERANTYLNILMNDKVELSETLLLDLDNTYNTVIHNFLSRNFIDWWMKMKRTSPMTPTLSSSTTNAQFWIITKIP